MESSLYQAILARQSVRRYDRQPLDAGEMAQVEAIVAAAQPLVPECQFKVLRRDTARGENLVETLGGYGLIVSPPHYLVPYGIDASTPQSSGAVLVDAGFRVEQIAVRLVEVGLGSCYIGSLGREAQVRAHLDLPAEARIGAFLIFGHPATGLGGRAFNMLMHRAAGAANKMPADRLFYRDTFDAPTAPPPELAPLIEAGRSAPSAMNVQPWRFLWHAGALYLFVERSNRKYAMAGAEYRYHDGGVCMGNIALASEALGMSARWQLLSDDSPDLPGYPATLEPLGRMALG